MKKKITYLWIGVLAMGLLSGCGDKDDRIKMSPEEFLSYCELNVELTEDNWQEYFQIRENVSEEEIYSEEQLALVDHIEPWRSHVLEIRDNGLGNVVDTTALRFHVTGTWHLTEYTADKEECYSMDDPEVDEDYDIEWGGSEIKEILCVYSYAEMSGADGGYRKTSTDVDSLEMTKIMGTMNFAFIPEDKWNVDEDGVRYIIVEKDEGEYAEYYENRVFREYKNRYEDGPYVNDLASIHDMICYVQPE